MRQVTVRMEQSQGTELDIGFTFATEQEMRDNLGLPEPFGSISNICLFLEV